MNLRGVRVVYGAVLATAPALAVHVVGSRPLGGRALAFVRVLGVRHLVQAAVVGPRAGPLTLLGATVVDALHAVSMVGLGAASSGLRRVAVCDAVIETGFTVADATCVDVADARRLVVAHDDGPAPCRPPRGQIRLRAPRTG